MNRSGLTLFETMVALVILGMVVVGFLELFAATTRATRDLELWSQAVAHAENAVEAVKIDHGYASGLELEDLPDGFERGIELRPWGTGLQLATVTVLLPDGRSLTVNRLLGTP